MALQVKPAEYVGTHVILTGPIKGSVTLADGTVIDVSEPVIEAPLDQHGEIAHLIGQRYAAEGHPDHTDVPFVHACTELCPQVGN